MKNMIFAIEAAPAAIPVNPSIPAIIAITMKMIVQRNIRYRFYVIKFHLNFLINNANMPRENHLPKVSSVTTFNFKGYCFE
jgi:hypothetical protein